MTQQRPHLRGRQTYHPEDDPRLHERMRAPTGPSVHERLLDVISGSWVSRRAGMDTSKQTGVTNSRGSALIWPSRISSTQWATSTQQRRRKERQTQIHAQRKKSSENVPSS